MTSQTTQNSEKVLVLLLGTLAAIGPLSIDMYLPSFPLMAESLGTTLSRVESSLATYFAGLSLGQLFYGPIADRYGRRPPLVVGLLLYVVASIGCATANSIETVIAWRFLQALGACSGMVVSRAIIRDSFTNQDAARIFSMLMLVMGAAPILAPLAGGYLAQSSGWRSIFWVLVVFSLLCWVALVKFLSETQGPRTDVKFSRVLPTYWSIMKSRSFLRFAISGGIAQAGMFAYITGSPFVFIEFFGIPAERFGWIFGANALGLIIMSQVNARLVRRFTPERILAITLSLLALSGCVLLISGLLPPNLWLTLAPIFIYVSVLGATFPNSTAAAMMGQAGHAGSASALLGTIQMLLASCAAGVVSQLHGGDLPPMSWVVGGCGVLSLVIFIAMGRGTPRHPPAH